MIGARRFVIVLVGCVLLVLPSPAAAKGIDQTLAIVSGPGLDHPLILEREEWSQAVVIGRLIGDSPEVSRPPADRLGPAYEVHLQVSVPRDGWPSLTLIRQRLYPYATPAPVTYTPLQFWRNPFGRNRIEPSWQVFPPTMVEQLQRFGLPERPPGPSTSAGTAFPLRLAAVPMAMVIAAVAGRRRDQLLS
jgi:hypothetical protein